MIHLINLFFFSYQFVDTLFKVDSYTFYFCDIIYNDSFTISDFIYLSLSFVIWLKVFKFIFSKMCFLGFLLFLESIYFCSSHFLKSIYVFSVFPAHVSMDHRKSEENIRCTGVTNGCEPPCGCRESNLGPLEATAESSLQFLRSGFYYLSLLSVVGLRLLCKPKI